AGEGGDPGRVVAAVLQAPEPLEQDRLRLPVADVADDAAHRLGLAREKDSPRTRMGRGRGGHLQTPRRRHLPGIALYAGSANRETCATSPGPAARRGPRVLPAVDNRAEGVVNLR